MQQRQKREYEQEENVFERELLIHAPEAFREYQKRKEERLEENLGYDEIVWRAPETIEEAMEITSTISNALHSIPGFDVDLQEQMEALQQFGGIDISLLGDEDG